MICDRPIYVKTNKFRADVPIPCGQCPPCLKRRVDSWVFRLREEDKIASSSHFVTLTYDTRSVPISPNGFMTLQKSDFQNFMKRLRKITGAKNIKYYACGEYGTQNKRPHYHAIIFNVPTAAAYAEAWALSQVALGQIDVGQVSGDSIAYTCKYMQKAKTIPQHKRDDRQPEFSLQSKGLGASYLTGQVVKYHKQNVEKLCLTLPGGHIIAMPKYYREKIFSAEEKSRQLHYIHDVMNEKRQKITLRLEAQGRDPDKVLQEQKMNRYYLFLRNANKRTL